MKWWWLFTLYLIKITICNGPHISYPTNIYLKQIWEHKELNTFSHHYIRSVCLTSDETSIFFFLLSFGYVTPHCQLIIQWSVHLSGSQAVFEPSSLLLSSHRQTCQPMFTHCSVKYGLIATAEVLKPWLWPCLPKLLFTSGGICQIVGKYGQQVGYSIYYGFISMGMKILVLYYETIAYYLISF